MRKMTLTTAVVAVMTLTANISFAQTKKYEVKSGIVTYEVTITMNGKTISTEKNILYFDEYGSKERSDKFKKEAIVGSSIYNGKTRYELNHKKKTYGEIQSAGSVGYKVNFNDIPEEDRKSGNAKKLTNETILGKSCETYSYEKIKSKFSGYRGVLFLQETSSANLVTTQKAIKFEEVNVSSDKFTVPNDYTKP
jgi:hypothetical protein